MQIVIRLLTNKLVNTILNSMEDDNIKARMEIWVSAFNGIREALILRNELRSFTKYDLDTLGPKLSENIRQLKCFKCAVARPHNLYLTLFYGWKI